MNDIIIKISKTNRTAFPNNTFLGNDGENLQNNLVFIFTDYFIDGVARLEYSLNDTKNFIWLDKKGNSYSTPIRNILTKEGNVSFQLVITEEANVNGTPLYKSDIFNLYCKASINAIDEAPSGYELWIDEANQKLMEFDKKIKEVDNLNIEGKRVGSGIEVKITDKYGFTKTIKVNDGIDGNGIESITKTSTVGLVDTYTIYYTNGDTSTFNVTNGKDGDVTQEQFEKALMVYNALPKVSDTDTSILLENTANCLMKLNLKGNTYQNGTPTPISPITVNTVTGNNTINIIGKNLLDVLTSTTATTTDGVTNTINSNGSITVSGTPTSTTHNIINKLDFSGLLEAGTYTFSISKTLPSSIKLRVWFEDETNADIIIAKNYLSNTYTSAKKITSWRLWLSGITTGTAINETFYIQFEKNSTATTIEPYVSNSYVIPLGSIELCKIGDYQDYIYKNNGNWYIHKEIGKVVLDGSENWNISNNVFYRGQSSYIGSGINVISNNFVGADNQASTSNVNTYNPSNSICCSSSGSNRFYIKTNVASTTDDFKTWLSTHNTTAYYVLAKPIYEVINDIDLIRQLETLTYAYSYNDETNINQTNDNIPFIITATAIRSMVNIFDGGE